MSTLMDLYWANKFYEGKPIKPFSLKIANECLIPGGWIFVTNENQIKFALEHYICILDKYGDQWNLVMYDGTKYFLRLAIGEWMDTLTDDIIGKFVIVSGFRNLPKELKPYINYNERRLYIVTFDDYMHEETSYLVLSYGKVICTPKQLFDSIRIQEVGDVIEFDPYEIQVALTKNDWRNILEKGISFGKNAKYIYNGFLVNSHWLEWMQKHLKI